MSAREAGAAPGPVPAPPEWKDDWLAILAFAAYTVRTDPAEAFAAWRHLSEVEQGSWRRVAVRVQAAIREHDSLADL